MIEPRFLLHPNLEKREENLKETLELFEVIMNKRGKSIIFNLLGNIEFNRGNTAKAVEWYRESVKQIEELIMEVDEQDKGEKGLTDEEKEKLNFNEEKKEINWETEKVCLKDMLIDKKQQLCMGLIRESSNSALDINESRSILKETNKYQKEILQYYSDNKIQYFRLIKMLIDMARVYKELKYYHSGIELLDFVQDELKKLEIDGAGQIDIDTARLSKLGVITNDQEQSNQNLHFSIKGYTFERDILMQMAYYHRAKICKECDKPYEAGQAYTSVIVIKK
jgi:tetratricopeptide (TPR) repeat protein